MAGISTLKILVIKTVTTCPKKPPENMSPSAGFSTTDLTLCGSRKKTPNQENVWYALGLRSCSKL